MRPVATDGVAWSVYLSVGHVHEPCKHGWTDRGADWRVDSESQMGQGTMYYMGSRSPKGKGLVLEVVWPIDHWKIL